MMQVVMNFLFKDIEYMVYEVSDYMPGQAGIELLCSRMHGIGADRILVVENIHNEPILHVFTSNGIEVNTTEHDYLVFAYYLRHENINSSNTHMIKFLGDTALLKLSKIENNISCMEIHLTSYFCDKMKYLDKNNHILAS
ncbi:hypothetical protein [Pectinatus sottacetonis]|uniref:hypothetical protein n=1 Tax=Pectinatus sottacetonis TaxID=1002795 RepID=UPI0018C4D615|nr:hypothetical protein [Pectinatus sottacetonis]